ncbi:MAG: response regulator transcription factor [Saprospiraceae bacterium]|nr:response regulator transcription factor [Saprospiraceae bacterium]
MPALPETILIAEDHAAERACLKRMLLEQIPGLKPSDLMEAENGQEAKNKIIDYKPDLVFLDIEMPFLSGIQMLESLRKEGHPMEFGLVFVTEFDKYWLDAFRHAALHYLLKPVKPEELKEAFQRHHDKRHTKLLIDNFINSKSDRSNRKTIPLIDHKTNNVVFVDPGQILYFHALSDLCEAYLSDGTKLLQRQNLGKYEYLAEDTSLENTFERVHNSYIVNLEHVIAAGNLPNDAGEVKISNGELIRVARTRKRQTWARLRQLYPGINFL